MPKNSEGRNVAEIIPDKCLGCQLCVGECPVSAIDASGDVVRINPEMCTGCGKCAEVCPSGAILFEKPQKKVETANVRSSSPSDYRGVAVFIEVRNGVAADVSWELAGKARELAAKLGTQVFGFLLGYKVGDIAKDAIAYGCDIVYSMDSEMLEEYISKIYGNALVQLCDEVSPEIFLIGGTPLGRDLASVVATHLETGLTADCTGLDINAEERLLMMTRPSFGGNIMATILCRHKRPQMSTVRPKVMKMPPKDSTRHGEVRPVKYTGYVEIVPRILEVIPHVAEAGGEDITRSPALIVLGKGTCDTKYFPMLEELALLLGGTIACSRPVVEAGLLPYLRQVGLTGKTVAPKLYIGIGVSGSVQHMVGMQGSKKIVAINTDRNAPLMQIADYAIVGDYVKIVPQLIEGLKARLSALKNGGAGR